MTTSLRGRDFLKELDFTTAEMLSLLDLAAELKVAKRDGAEVQRMTRRNIALIFEKTSTRTRISFEVAAFDQGAHVTLLDPSGSQIGAKESTADTARVLARMYDAIEYRGSSHSTVEELARFSDVPVYNGLTDEWHPTQMLADFLTMREHANRPFNEIAYAYMGDARSNMGNSTLVMGAMMGSDVRIVAPAQLWPAESVQQAARERADESGGRITLTESPAEGLEGVDFVHTDVWVSMGEADAAWQERIELLMPYRVTTELLELTQNRNVKFLHCLPAFHDTDTEVGARIAKASGLLDGIEVTDEVFRSPVSLVWEQAAARVCTTEALFRTCIA
jgi:ornithine carbamoyltransferase